MDNREGQYIRVFVFGFRMLMYWRNTGLVVLMDINIKTISISGIMIHVGGVMFNGVCMHMGYFPKL